MCIIKEERQYMSRENKKYSKGTSEKDLMRLYRRQHQLYNNMAALGYEELTVPIRKGYEKKFILRADIARNKKAPFFKALLAMVNTPILSRDREFMKKDYKTKKSVPMKHELDVISVKEYVLLTPRQQKYFSKDHYFNWMQQYTLRGYVLNLPPWYFSTKVSPHYICKVKITNVEMEQEYDEIQDYFSTNNLWCKIDNILGVKSSHDDWWKPGRVVKAHCLKIEQAKEIREYLLQKGEEDGNHSKCR